ncbi:MAG: hypothetical protein U9R22_01640 [Pseudomonadota bacterium]|nr:hypothetical protein [Pseudomonadota bacterium]
MSDIPEAPTSPADGPTAPSPPGELDAWLGMLRQAAAAGATLSSLAGLELRLALADGRRLLLLGLLILPLAGLAWLGFSALVGWWVWQALDAVTHGLLAFLALQLGALLAVILACRRYAASLSLPATRRHLRALMEGAGDGAKPADR